MSDQDKDLQDLRKLLEDHVSSERLSPTRPADLVKFQIRMTRQERATLKMVAANLGATMEQVVMGLVRARLAAVSPREFEALWGPEDKADPPEIEEAVDQLRQRPFTYFANVEGVTIHGNHSFGGELVIQPVDQAEAYEEEADRQLSRHRQLHGLTCDLDNVEDDFFDH